MPADARRRRETWERPEEALAEGAGRLGELAGAATALLRNVAQHVVALVEEVGDDSLEVAREAEALYESARERIDDARDAVRIAPRATRLVSEGVTLVARYRLSGALAAARAELVGDAGSLQQERTRERIHRQSARRLRALCEELRGGVLKLGQFASTRADWLPEAYVEELSKLQDRVPPIPTAALSARLADELGPDWGRRFASFEPAPLAAASLAQVHGATLADGTPVAVKLLVPGIEDVVETDLTALRILLPTLRELLPRADLDTLAAELTRSVRRELDLEAEAEAARALREAFAGDPDVIVPRIHGEASTRSVLVMERIDGERLTDFLAGCAARGEQGARDRDRLFEILIRCFCEQVLVYGIFQGDPHPGNFLVVPGEQGPRLALLDFGCVERWDAPRRATYAALGVAILARDEARMAELFAELGFHSRDGTIDGLRAYAEMFLEAFREDASLAGSDHGAHVRRILALTAEDPIDEIPADFVLLGRVFATLGGLLVQHRPEIRLSNILHPSVAAALRPGQPAETAFR